MPGCEDQFPLTEPQSRQLIGAILDAIETHREVHGRPVGWAAFQDMLPEALQYPPELLREMTRRCAVFGLLRGYSDHGEAFSTEGLTALGGLAGADSRESPPAIGWRLRCCSWAS